MNIFELVEPSAKNNLIETLILRHRVRDELDKHRGQGYVPLVCRADGLCPLPAGLNIYLIVYRGKRVLSAGQHIHDFASERPDFLL